MKRTTDEDRRLVAKEMDETLPYVHAAIDDMAEKFRWYMVKTHGWNWPHGTVFGDRALWELGGTGATMSLQVRIKMPDADEAMAVMASWDWEDDEEEPIGY